MSAPKTPRYDYNLALKAYNNAVHALNEANRSWRYAHERLLKTRTALDEYVRSKAK